MNRLYDLASRLTVVSLLDSIEGDFRHYVLMAKEGGLQVGEINYSVHTHSHAVCIDSISILESMRGQKIASFMLLKLSTYLSSRFPSHSLHLGSTKMSDSGQGLFDFLPKIESGSGYRINIDRLCERIDSMQSPGPRYRPI